MNSPDLPSIWRDGLWNNNAGLVQLLGLCPLLAVSGTLVNALGLGLATVAVLVVSNLAVSLLRSQITREIRIPVFVVIIAAAVTATELLARAYVHDLYVSLGIFIPLIVTNCAIIGRAEAFASRHDPLRAAVDGLATGLGFAACLVAVGGIREVIGHGTLLANAHLLFGESARGWTVRLAPWEDGLLLALLPPGAFLVLGALVAGKRWLDGRARPEAVTAGERIAVESGP